MDSFFRRLKYYGIGFGIGLVFVIFLFQQKGCSWTPGNRVKSAILERIVFVDSLDQNYLKQHHISSKSLRKFIENGTVSFLKSKRHGKEKLYHFHGEIKKGKSLDCLIAYREKSVVVDVDFLHAKTKEYQRLKGLSRPFLYKKKNWFSGKWKLYNLKGIVASNAPEKITKLFYKNGQLDCDKSTFHTSNPYSYITISHHFSRFSTQHIELKTIWYQEKMEIDDLSLMDEKSNN